MTDMEPTDPNTPETERRDRTSFYTHAAKYWSAVPATVDGMLGGFGIISQTDIQGSVSFLKQLFKNPPGHERALDCGAGIGRITKYLLLRFFNKVDLVEQNASFLEEAKNFIGICQKVGSLYCVGLQDFSPEPKTYDLIWCQWVLGHLTDEDLIDFLKSCKRGLKPNGIIVVKENLTSSDKVEVDKEDSSVTRPITLLRILLKQAGLHCIKEQKQNNFPRGLYTVKMFALVPDIISTATNSNDNSYTTKLSVTSGDNGHTSPVG
ncbi:N-terminal Xaa-Pro-Lys N-methyltransferase 1 isoform X2 [Cryptotermes secundus]|uniref:N-terminal Xaa-Pro-Lys N-methyltransferase 1 isoform X2 n=1 Tax=Cryptotermes secundus TaxID=105785 RepID=UPI000CD7B435|nr:N-terminal Xaa-Pro-Lys N-methyltransferase 1 isoform X2 [Cryptotermes secundus]